MIKIKLGLDKLNSMLISYYVLCAPTQRTQKYNPELFENLTLSPEERGHYLSYFISNGITLDQMDSFRTSTLFPCFKTLDDYLSSYGRDLPAEVQKI